MLVIAAMAASTDASTIVLQSVATVTLRSNLIVRGVPKPGSSVVTWNKDHRLIVTRTTLTVRETLHADAAPPAEIVVETLGGYLEADKIGMIVPGSPTFVDGEEVVLFLWGSAVEQPYHVLDLSAGKFELVAQDGKQVATRRDLGAAETLGDGAKPTRDWSELRAEITVAVAAKQAAGQAAKAKENK